MGRRIFFAFTLAEVLITLGIIGVVAAITLPTLINKTQDRQNIAKWKKEYSVISNVFNQILSEDIPICMTYDERYGGCTYGPDSYYNDFSNEFVESFMSKLKMADYCGLNGIVPSGKQCDNYSWVQNVKYKWSGVANIYSQYKALESKGQGNINAYNFDSFAILLNDSAVVYMGDLWGGPWICVDVNNFQNGPNEIGRDFFCANVSSNIKTNVHWIKPTGAEGTPSWNDPSKGASGCSKDIGTQKANSLYDAAGIGCSAKYLNY